MRTSTLQQKNVLLNMLQRLCQDPQALVEIYLNYDCDLNAVENIYERLMNIISKQSTSKASLTTTGTSTPDAGSGKGLQSPPPSAKGHSLPPSLTTSKLAETSVAGDSPALEAKLHRQSLESLVFVLKSLVAWKDAASKNVAQAQGTIDGSGTNGLSVSEHGSASALGRTSGDEGRLEASGSGSTEALAGRTSNVSGGGSGGGSIDLRVTTPIELTDSGRRVLEDDPTRFESEKMRKMTMAEGLRKFNLKPKRVSCFAYD
jgi:brefeldin A-inhibited guanine nucleotide-exchange protein